ncbi:hypothetical protein [Azospirillum melinis]
MAMDVKGAGRPHRGERRGVTGPALRIGRQRGPQEPRGVKRNRPWTEGGHDGCSFACGRVGPSFRRDLTPALPPAMRGAAAGLPGRSEMESGTCR